MYVPVVVLGELYYGAFNSGRVQANLARIDRFALDMAVLTGNKGTAREYGQIEKALRNNGRPIPENDMWIAAIARQRDLILAIRDNHFSHVDNLKYEMW